MQASIKPFGKTIRFKEQIYVNYLHKYCLLLGKYRIQIYALLVLLSLALLQSTLLNYLRIFNFKPNIILAGLIICFLLFDIKSSVAFAFLLGVLRDLMSVYPFGFNTVICILWAVVVKRISKRLNVENFLVRNVMLFVIIVLNSLVMRFILFIPARSLSMGAFLRSMILEIIFTLALALPMYSLFTRMFHRSIKAPR